MSAGSPERLTDDDKKKIGLITWRSNKNIYRVMSRCGWSLQCYFGIAHELLDPSIDNLVDKIKQLTPCDCPLCRTINTGALAL